LSSPILEILKKNKLRRHRAARYQKALIILSSVMPACLSADRRKQESRLFIFLDSHWSLPLRKWERESLRAFGSQRVMKMEFSGQWQRRLVIPQRKASGNSPD